MKRDLVTILCCPSCKGQLELLVNETGKGEIKEGALLCKCGKRFKISAYIPRFVDTDTYTDSFSFEWNIHRTTQIDSEKSKESTKDFWLKTGFFPDLLKGKRILDVGCGVGRYLAVAARYQCEVVGIDLSFAVDAAFQNFGIKKNVHIIQADLFDLPFPEETFDLIFSIGVLHHTPNCREAFLRLPRLLKQDGRIAIWVYPKLKPQYEYIETINRFWRYFTVKMPKRMLYALSLIAIPYYYAQKIPIIGEFLKILINVSSHPNWRWRVLDTFDWYSPLYQSKHTYSEVIGWFRECQLKDIKVGDWPVSVSGERVSKISRRV